MYIIQKMTKNDKGNYRIGLILQINRIKLINPISN